MTTADAPAPEDRMLAVLQRAYAERTGGGVAMILLGGGVLLIAGFVLTTLIWLFLFYNFGSAFIGWLGWFIVYVAAIVGVLVREQKQSQQPFMLSTHDSSRKLTAIADKLLWAPRTLLSGIATFRGQQPMRFRGLLARASRVAARLAVEKEPLLIIKLVETGESPAQFYEVIEWLDDNDHIGLSSDRQRAWISSKLRGRLAADRA